jgi:hypothetical protein
MIILQVLITTSNTKLLNANYEPKAPIFTPYILEEEKWMDSQPHSLYLFPMYQTNHHMSLITFHPFMDRFYVI